MKNVIKLSRILKASLIAFPMIYSLNSNAQLYAMAEYGPEKNILIDEYYSKNNNDLNGPWFSYSEGGELEKVEIYNKGIVVDTKYGEEAKIVLLQTNIEDLNLKLINDRNLIESLYTGADPLNIEKKIILNSYKIVMLDLQLQLTEVSDLEKFQDLSNEIKIINRNVMNYYTMETKDLEKELSILIDADKMKNLLLK